jgi:hypothetical protein
VTTEDYEALALDFKGVGKVRAEATNWNTIALFVAPEGGGQVSDVLEANLLSYFEDKRAVSTIIEIKDVDYVKVFVTATVGVQSFYSQEDIRDKVKQAAAKLLVFENVDFGTTIYLSKFFEAIEAIDGVEYVNITEFRAEGRPPNGGQPPDKFESSGKLSLSNNEIPTVPDDREYDGGIRIERMEGGI